MKRFQSQDCKSTRAIEELYLNISDFQHLGHLMPEQIVNWETSGDECSFTIKNMADITLRYQQRKTNRFVLIESVKAPFRLELTIVLSETSGAVFCKTSLNADLNPMLAMLASRPLQHLVDSISNKLVHAG